MGHIRFQTTLAVVEFSYNEETRAAEQEELDSFMVLLNHRVHEEVRNLCILKNLHGSTIIVLCHNNTVVIKEVDSFDKSHIIIIRR